MYSLSLSQQYPITIRLSINIAVMPNLRMSIQRSSAGKHRRHLCIHNGAANVIMTFLLFYLLLPALHFVSEEPRKVVRHGHYDDDREEEDGKDTYHKHITSS